MDGNFIFQALKYKIEISDRLSKLLQDAEVRLYVQRSVLDELKSVGEKTKTSYEFASKLCTVIDDAEIPGETPAAKLVTMLENLFEENKTGKGKSPKYMLATQDKDLRNKVAHIPGVPLLYFNKVSIVLEPPSDTSRHFSESMERQKSSAQTFEVDVANTLKRKKNIVGVTGDGPESEEAEPAEETRARKKRKAIAANPLSVIPPSKDSKNSKRRKISKFRKSS